MKVVIDTNVFVSGIFWKGEPNKVLELWKQGRITLVRSDKTLSEFIRVLNDFKIQLPKDLIHDWVNLILINSILVKPKEKLEIVKGDPDDNKFIEAAFEGEAEYIITNDKHLFKLKSYKRIRIIKPEEFNQLF